MWRDHDAHQRIAPFAVQRLDGVSQRVKIGYGNALAAQGRDQAFRLVGEPVEPTLHMHVAQAHEEFVRIGRRRGAQPLGRQGHRRLDRRLRTQVARRHLGRLRNLLLSERHAMGQPDQGKAQQ
jgi:hypothetical protein